MPHPGDGGLGLQGDSDIRGGTMGFMDKAKQMAEQAQKKVEEAQTKFNENQAQKAGPGDAQQQAPVQYDSAGRPIQQERAPAAAPMPTAPAPDPTAGPQEPPAAPAETPAEPAAAPTPPP